MKDNMSNNTTDTNSVDIVDNTNSGDTVITRQDRVLARIKLTLNNIFIVGLGGMAQGLFATLIVGTILCQIASIIPGQIGVYLNSIGTFAKVLMGCGIGVAVAKKFNSGVLVTVSCGVVGLIGAFAGQIVSGTVIEGTLTKLISVGEPLGAFIGAYFACYVGNLVAGKTSVDILVTPIVTLVCGSTLALLVGSPISTFMSAIGSAINYGTVQQPLIMGIIVSTIMGICLTLPISSAAIGVSLSLGGLAAGAGVVGCCCQMVGFAIISARDNRYSSLVSVGIGTSMLLMPNIIKKPIIWVPSIVASAILGALSTTVFGITSNAIGSGMGTAGLVGPIMTVTTMISSGGGVMIVLLKVITMTIVLPAVVTYLVYFLLKKCNLISSGDMVLAKN